MRTGFDSGPDPLRLLEFRYFSTLLQGFFPFPFFFLFNGHSGLLTLNFGQKRGK